MGVTSVTLILCNSQLQITLPGSQYKGDFTLACSAGTEIVIPVLMSYFQKKGKSPFPREQRTATTMSEVYK